MARNEPNQDGRGSGSLLRNVLAGFVISLVISLFLLLVFAVVMNAIDSETLSGSGGSRVLSALAVCAGVLFGSGVTASRIRSRGFFTGGLIGMAMYVFIMFLSLVTAGRINLSGFYPYLLLACLFMSGAVGGVAGINLRRMAHKR